MSSPKLSSLEKFELDSGEELPKELEVKDEVVLKCGKESEERPIEESDEKCKEVMEKSILKERLMEKSDDKMSLERVMEKSMEDFKPENTEKHPFVLIRISRQPQIPATADPNTTVQVATKAPVNFNIQPITSANANSVILKKLPAILPRHGANPNKAAPVLLMKDQLSSPVSGFIVPPTNLNNNNNNKNNNNNNNNNNKSVWSKTATTFPQISKVPVIHQSAQIQNKLVPVRVIDSNGQSQVKNVLTPVVMPSAQLESNLQQARIQKIFGGIKGKGKPLVPSSQSPSFTVKSDKPLIPCTASMKDNETTEKKVIILLTEEEVKYIESSRKRKELSRLVEDEDIEEIRPMKMEKQGEAEVAHETETQTTSEMEEENVLLNCESSVCPICQKELKTAHLMRRHIRSIHKKTLSCDKCDKVYSTRQGLIEHQKAHEDDFYLECSICHLRYKRKAGLRHHQIRVHSNIEAKYMCDHCGKRFKLKVDLGLHIEKIHMYSSHICKICGKLVKDVANHEWRHEMTATKASSRRYRCTLCPKKFSTRNNLDNHLLLHRDGFKCNHCDEIHQSQSSLVRHKAAKHRTTVMTCPVCERSFNSSSNLHQHVLTHAGIRPYRCDICDEDFTQRSSMLRHRRTHPGPLPPFTESTPIANIAKHVLEKLRNETKQNSDTE
ncbi:zinc finger protein 62 homolog [Ceratina calcarata]|uniref:Zinc finger protein 62 homolog n=1 Tax=Ceratina calcarata TaxID=156304 RepID=A0AAJ7RZV1_9HYME|nr:zinc finger protein 62 homolog [Ceratina calcarata]